MNEVRIEGRCLWARASNLSNGGTVTKFALAIASGKGSCTVLCVAWSSDVGDVEIAKDGYYRLTGRLSWEKPWTKRDGTQVPGEVAVTADGLEEAVHKSTRPKTPPPARPTSS